MRSCNNVSIRPRGEMDEFEKVRVVPTYQLSEKYLSERDE